eukprot:2205893-Rhodomonas_salina.2
MTCEELWIAERLYGRSLCRLRAIRTLAMARAGAEIACAAICLPGVRGTDAAYQLYPVQY